MTPSTIEKVLIFVVADGNQGQHNEVPVNRNRTSTAYHLHLPHLVDC
jgi:hypothetical protein